MLTRRLTTLLAAPVLLAVPLAAQPGRSPSDDLLAAMTRAVNDVRYDEAIRLGRDLEPFAAQLQPRQVARLRQLLALAWFPEETEQQRPDSALRQLVALVRARPDATLAPELSWPGLDSLHAAARARTFAVALVPVEGELVADGATGAVLEVASTRLARVRLSLLDRATGREVRHDSVLVRDRAVLRLRAHDGVDALVREGAYELRLVAHEPGGRDTLRVAHPVTTRAGALALAPLPVLDAARLRPEREPPQRARTVVQGLVYGVATAAIGSVARGGGRNARQFEPDPRAAGVGGLITLGAVAVALTDKGRAIPEAVEANAAVRAEHARALTAAREANQRALAEYRVTLVVGPAAP